jgi:hypothetical protein
LNSYLGKHNPTNVSTPMGAVGKGSKAGAPLRPYRDKDVNIKELLPCLFSIARAGNLCHIITI